MRNVVLGFQIVCVPVDCQSRNKIGLRLKLYVSIALLLHLQTCWSKHQHRSASSSMMQHGSVLSLDMSHGLPTRTLHAQYQPFYFCCAVCVVLRSSTLFCIVHEFITVEEPRAPPLLTSVGPPLRRQRADSPFQALRSISDSGKAAGFKGQPILTLLYLKSSSWPMTNFSPHNGKSFPRSSSVCSRGLLSPPRVNQRFTFIQGV